jgi:hypothetical protein
MHKRLETKTKFFPTQREYGRQDEIFTSISPRKKKGNEWTRATAHRIGTYMQHTQP